MVYIMVVHPSLIVPFKNTLETTKDHLEPRNRRWPAGSWVVWSAESILLKIHRKPYGKMVVFHMVEWETHLEIKDLPLPYIAKWLPNGDCICFCGKLDSMVWKRPSDGSQCDCRPVVEVQRSHHLFLRVIRKNLKPRHRLGSPRSFRRSHRMKWQKW